MRLSEAVARTVRGGNPRSRSPWLSHPNGLRTEQGDLACVDATTWGAGRLRSRTNE